MARIKDLRLKVEDGTATPEEITELEELEAEANEPAKTTDEGETAAEKLMTGLVSKFEAMIEAKAKSIEATRSGAPEGAKVINKAAIDNMTADQRIGEFIKSLVINDKLNLKVLSEGVNADGGFLVPQVWYNKIVEEMRDDAIIRPLANVIEDCPKQLNINQLATRPIVKWRGEKALKDTSTVGFAQISLTPYSLAVIVVLTKELVSDAEVGLPQGIIQYVTDKVATAIIEEEDRVFAVGTGTTQPTGIDNYANSVPRSVTTPANVVDVDSFISAYYKLGQKYRKRAVWLMNSLTMAKVQQLKDGQGRHIFIPDPSAETAGSILGRPVYEQNNLPQSRVWFGDLKGYWIGVREGISVMQSEEATITGVGNLFENNEVAVRVEERVDGEIADLHAFVVINGTN